MTDSTGNLVSLDAGLIDDVVVVTDYSRDDGVYLGKMARYWCEGCGYAHEIGVHQPGQEPYKGGASWEWNARFDDQITLKPSQLHKTGHFVDGTPQKDCWLCKDAAAHGNHKSFCKICHSFIGINGAPPGHIIWLNDSLHELKGVTRKLLPRKEWPDMGWAKLAYLSL